MGKKFQFHHFPEFLISSRFQFVNGNKQKCIFIEYASTYKLPEFSNTIMQKRTKPKKKKQKNLKV